MKLLRGKNWITLSFDKHGHAGIYIGPFYSEEKDILGKYDTKLYFLMSRRFKIRLLKIRSENKWEFSFGGLWSSEGTKNQYTNYHIKVSELINER